MVGVVWGSPKKHPRAGRARQDTLDEVHDLGALPDEELAAFQQLLVKAMRGTTSGDGTVQ